MDWCGLLTLMRTTIKERRTFTIHIKTRKVVKSLNQMASQVSFYFIHSETQFASADLPLSFVHTNAESGKEMKLGVFD